MRWTHATAFGLARDGCAHCEGDGVRAIYRGDIIVPCGCALREVFRLCLRRFRECVETARVCGTVSWEYSPSTMRGCPATREEFMADFYLLARRALDEAAFRLFYAYYVEREHWMKCVVRFQIDKGLLFHRLYKIERDLGRVFAETEPYGLYPVDEYFGHRTKSDRTRRALEALNAIEAAESKQVRRRRPAEMAMAA